MSFVGPRPNTPLDVSMYSLKEKELLFIRPGITDFASIVFSDEGHILEGSDDPALDYNQLISHWKSRLGFFYTNNQTSGILTYLSRKCLKYCLGNFITLLKAGFFCAI